MKIEPITVSELNRYMKNKVADDEFLNSVFVRGEISNFKNHYSGHMYFTLKDENSLIKCVMFKTSTATLKFMPKDGMKVLVLGSVSVFERDGVYQIYCKAMQEDGMGSLHEEFERLKNKLEQEGLFEQERKKKIPIMPKIIGVLTSKTGSVIRDIINVSTRRNPNVYLRLLPVPVQGEGAAEKIAKAISTMNEQNLADVIIIARGGGSLEDLWPFNEEIVARAIAESEIPVISAVGHETDFTIADFVADLRAPTPSAAAELAVADINQIKNRIENNRNQLKHLLKNKIEVMKLRYEKCMHSRVYTNPLQPINEAYFKIDNLTKNIQNAIQIKLHGNKSDFAKMISKLETLSPLHTLMRGYTVTQKENKIVNKHWMTMAERRQVVIVLTSYNDETFNDDGTHKLTKPSQKVEAKIIIDFIDRNVKIDIILPKNKASNEENNTEIQGIKKQKRYRILNKKFKVTSDFKSIIINNQTYDIPDYFNVDMVKNEDEKTWQMIFYQMFADEINTELTKRGK